MSVAEIAVPGEHVQHIRAMLDDDRAYMARAYDWHPDSPMELLNGADFREGATEFEGIIATLDRESVLRWPGTDCPLRNYLLDGLMYAFEQADRLGGGLPYFDRMGAILALVKRLDAEGVTT